ncbi:MAG: PDZ domain-containing protein [Armatimonadetes bacterium]|nr:PDZ domain-containing protein [Armatimonadota bacterium]
MFLSAAKVCAALLLSSQAIGSQVTEADRHALTEALRCSARVASIGKWTGYGVLIDPSGLFVLHRSAVAGQPLVVFGQNWSYPLDYVAADAPSGMILMRAKGWPQNSLAPLQPAEMVDRPISQSEPILAMLTGGPMRAEFVTDSRMGLVAPSNRMVSLSEVKFEEPLHQVGGAMLFTYDGRFLGALVAVLDPRNSKPTPQAAAAPRASAKVMASIPLSEANAADKLIQKFAETHQPTGGGEQTRALPRKTYGPQALTVAYTYGPDLLRRVINGFLSPSHKVLYPTIGIYCVDDKSGGATITKVAAGSAADNVHLEVGDTIMEIDGEPVRNQLDFAKVMRNKSVGQKINMRYRHGRTLFFTILTVGADAN